jgi:four helix bundle protein
MKNEGPLMKLNFDFALDIIKMYEALVKNKKEWVMSRQLLRSGTCIGAMVRESQHAESRKDFIHKLSIAQKEAGESGYWIELLYKTGYLEDEMFELLFEKCNSLRRLLGRILRSLKER